MNLPPYINLLLNLGLNCVRYYQWDHIQLTVDVTHAHCTTAVLPRDHQLDESQSDVLTRSKVSAPSASASSQHKPFDVDNVDTKQNLSNWNSTLRAASGGLSQVAPPVLSSPVS
ncbi:hypothetical protein BHE74_00018812 [Ensete ventricosum]|nr:hypothetical protein BHE74_00018812 [Ensete ventricosum]